MRKPRAVIINETAKGKKHLIKLLKGPVKKDSGLSFDIISAEDVTDSLRSNSKLLKGDIYFIAENPRDRQIAPAIAKKLSERGVNGGKVLTTSRPEPYKETLINPGYQEFYGWLPKNTAENFDTGEVIDKVDDFRKQGKLTQPISIGILGLGTLGIGTLVEAVRIPSVRTAQVYTGFVHQDKTPSVDNYASLLDSLDLPGEQREKIKPHISTIELLTKTSPDVLVVTQGKHGIDYEQYEKRTQLTEELFKTSLPKIDPILRTIQATRFKGLIAMQSNPNGHFIRYANQLGIPMNQLTSFPPDTVRHIAELYEYLKERFPSVKEEEVFLEAIGEHMKGGTPIYEKGLVGGISLFDVFPELKEYPQLQEMICNDARARGLKIVKSAKNYEHDYRGVPRRVRECLEDISQLRRTPRYPIYAGLLSAKAEFSYEPYSKNSNKVYARVKKSAPFTEITDDKRIRKELAKDLGAVIDETKKWQK